MTIGFRILAAKLRIFFHYFAFLCFFFLALRRISYFESHFLTERQSVAQSVKKPRFCYLLLLAPPYATHFFCNTLVSMCAIA